MLGAIEHAFNRRAWGQQEELLASVIDSVNALLIAFLQAWADPKNRGQIPTFTPYPRPTDPPKPKRRWFDVLASMPGSTRR